LAAGSLAFDIHRQAKRIESNFFIRKSFLQTKETESASQLVYLPSCPALDAVPDSLGDKNSPLDNTLKNICQYSNHN